MPARVPSHKPNRLPTPQPQARPPAEHDRIGRTKFTSHPTWRRLRAAYLAENPLCVDCLKADRLTTANTVHHVRARRNDPEREGWLDPENLMALCKSCHDVRTARGE